jgi:hypothetical protein
MSMSPESQNTAVMPPQDIQPRAQLAERMMNNAAIMGNSIPIDFTGLSSPNWPPLINDVATNYSQPYVPFSAGGQSRESSQGVSAQAATQSVTPNSVFAVDGHEWYLKDGVKWQAGFDAWNMVNAAQPSTALQDQQLFMFGQQSPANPANPNQVLPAMELNFDSLHALSSIDGWDLSSLE